MCIFHQNTGLSSHCLKKNYYVIYCFNGHAWTLTKSDLPPKKQAFNDAMC